MASGVQNQIAAELVQSFDRPISVSVIEKVGKFQFLQELGFGGQLSYAKEQFHGLSDWYQQMTMYSGASFMLSIPWAVIQAIARLNTGVLKNLSLSGALGMVGNAFKKMVGFSQVFAASSDELKAGGLDTITSKLSG